MTSIANSVIFFKRHIRNLMDDALCLYTRIRFCKHRRRSQGAKVVAVSITDARIFSVEEAIIRLNELPGVDVVAVFHDFGTTSSDAIARELRASLIKRLTQAGLRVVDASGNGSRGDAIRSFAVATVIITNLPYRSRDRAFNAWRYPAKLVYLPYTLRVFRLHDLAPKSKLTRRSGVAILESDWHLADYRLSCPDAKLLAVVGGFPRILHAESVTPNPAFQKFAGCKIVLWAPHFRSLETPENILYTTQLAQKLISLLSARRNTHLLFRPHPLFEQRLGNVDENNPVHTVLQELLGLNHVSRADGESVADLFSLIHVAVHNSGSFTAELVAAGKPTVFTQLPNDYIINSLTSFGWLCMRGAQIVCDAQTATASVSDILDGHDSLREVRNEVRNEVRAMTGLNSMEILLREVALLLEHK